MTTAAERETGPRRHWHCFARQWPRWGRRAPFPFAAYHSEELFALEMERVFRSDWVAVCAEAALAAPGDYLAIDIAGEPARADPGHGRRVAGAVERVPPSRHGPARSGSRQSRHGERIVCPYHGWSYSDSGSVPRRPVCAGRQDRPRRALSPLFPGTEVWMGVVFVCLSSQCPVAGRTACRHRPAPRRVRHGVLRGARPTLGAGSLGGQLETDRRERHGELPPVQGAREDARAGDSDSGGLLHRGFSVVDTHRRGDRARRRRYRREAACNAVRQRGRRRPLCPRIGPAVIRRRCHAGLLGLDNRPSVEPDLHPRAVGVAGEVIP